MAGDLHSVLLVHAAGAEVRRRGIAGMVEDEAAGLPTDRQARLLAGGPPRLLEVAEAPRPSMAALRAQRNSGAPSVERSGGAGPGAPNCATFPRTFAPESS